MQISFAEMLRSKRIEKGLSQQKLADMIHVDRSTLSGWEIGRRLPDVAMISLLSEVLSVDVTDFLRIVEKPVEKLVVIIIDDEKIILDGEINVLKEVLPNAEIYSFSEPDEAKEFLRINKVQLAVLDIEMGQISGFDLCKELIEINPFLNVLFLTAFPQYSLDAWKTCACGFLEKPLNADDLRGQLTRLRWPIKGMGEV